MPLFKLKLNPYANERSFLGYKWLEVLSIHPEALRPLEPRRSDGTPSGFSVQTTYTCRSEGGLVQISGNDIEQEISEETYVDFETPDESLMRAASQRENVRAVGLH